MSAANWGSPWYKNGVKKDGSIVGEGQPADEWRVGLFEICFDILTCKTQDVIPCCPPSAALCHEICFGQCAEFGGKAHALTGEDPDEATQCGTLHSATPSAARISLRIILYIIHK